MIEKFLKAKHWQLFSLIIGIPVVLYIVFMVNLFRQFRTEGNPDVLSMFHYFKFFPVAILLIAGLQFGWFWSVAIGLQKRVPENVYMKVRKFKIFFFIPLAYLTLMCLSIGYAFSGFSIGMHPNLEFLLSLLPLIVPLHLFSIFCMFYIMYFVAKTFKTVELQRNVNFSDFAGEFFLIWFYFVGIWVLQPKINKMVERSSVTKF